MPNTTVLILSPDEAFRDSLEQKLKKLDDSAYRICHRNSIDKLEEVEDGYSVVLLDENALNKDPENELATYSYKLAPAPIIYFTESVESQASFMAVKSLTFDYLVKGRITPSSLHNCIRYTLQAKRLKYELENQQKRYSSLFYNAVDPTFFLSKEWGLDNVNSSFAETFRVSPDECRVINFKDLICLQSDFQEITDLIDQGERFIDKELKFKRLSTGKSFTGHLKISVIREFDSYTGDSKKIVTGYQGSLTDISYRRRLRKMSEKADKIGMTYRLARTLAHEIRNPLTNVNLALSQLQNELKPEGEGTLYLDMIKRSTVRIDELLDQLLRSSERQRLERAECNLLDIVNAAIGEVEDRVNLLSIDLKRDYEVEQYTYDCDFDKLKIALTNLLTNAIEAIGEETGSITVGMYSDQDMACIYVEDSGGGMSEEDKKALFDPFYTRKKKGVGLGLTATQTIIADHGGHIEVESEEGAGSTFTISLPLAKL